MQRIERYLDFQIDNHHGYNVEELFNPNPARDLVIGRMFDINKVNDSTHDSTVTITIQQMHPNDYQIFVQWPGDDDTFGYRYDEATIYTFIDWMFSMLYTPRRMY